MKLKFNNKMIFALILIFLVPIVYQLYFKKEMFTDEDIQYIIKAGKLDDFLAKGDEWKKSNPAPTNQGDYAKWTVKETAWNDTYLKNLKLKPVPKETLATITTSFCDKAKSLGFK